MKTLIFLFLVLVLSFSLSLQVCGSAQNPFTAPQKYDHQPLTYSLKDKLFDRIITWQMQIRQKISGLIRQAKAGQNLAPVIWAALSAFLYGIIHSAGPGHGKAVALSYILSCRPGLFKSLAFGNLIAVTHGLSGIVFVLTVKFVLMASLTRSLDFITHITQVISFSLIGLIGLIIFFSGLAKWFKTSSKDEQKPPVRFTNPVATAIAVGIIPCPGVVMVMLFAISMDFTGFGILLGACIAMGMATTISLIVLAGTSGKAAILKMAAQNSRMQVLLENIIETLAGFMVAALGIIFLAATLNAG